MAIYQNSTANLGVKLEITHASPDIANNRTTITYKASVYKTGSHNPFNNYSQTPMYLTINGQSLHSTATGNYDLRGGTYQQLIKSGTLVIPHNSDGTKSFSFSWNVNFTSTGYGYGNVTASGTYTLPTIARASTFSIPSTTITTGSAFTVTINKASDGFRHKVAYIVGSSVNEWITNADTTYSATIPHSLFNSHKSADSVSGVIRVTTMNGSVEVGSNQRTVTINLTASATPTLASVSYTNSNKGMFSGTNQFIRNVSLPTIIAGTATGSYSSTISSYEFQTLRGSTVLETISKTANSQQFGAFNFPSSGSEAKVYMQARVRDSRGRYSGWVKTAELRVHHYAPPAIGTMTVKRTGSGNTTLQVNRNYVVTNMFEGGGTTNSNTASLSFQHRTKGTTSATNNTGAKSTTMYLTNSNANLAGTFAANTSYEVRAILSDKLNTVYGSWISVGTEFVPMDIGPKGVGVGKIHSDASYNLEVGSGGISVEGPIALTNSAVTGSIKDVILYINPPITTGGWARGLNFNDPSGNTKGALGHFGGGSSMAYSYFGETYDSNNAIRIYPGRAAGPTVGHNTIWHQGNDGSGSGLDADLLDGKHASTIVAEAIAGATSSGSTANGSWYQVGGLQICTQNFSIAGLYSAYTLTGTWTYPKSFKGNPIISATPRTNLTDPAEIMNGTLSVLGTPSSTSVEFSWMRQTGANFTSSSRKYLTVFAIGQV